MFSEAISVFLRKAYATRRYSVQAYSSWFPAFDPWEEDTKTKMDLVESLAAESEFDESLF
jgi:hypothetical protein